MKIRHTSLCSWAFDRKKEIYSAEEFSLLCKSQQKNAIDERLSFLSKVLEILKTEKVLLVNKLEINICGVKEELFFNNPNITFIFDEFRLKILNKYKLNEDLPICLIKGYTIIKTSRGERKIENIMDVFYSFGGNYFYIATYTDLWSPMDLDDNYQIDLAVLNNPRLKRCLQKIKALGGYSFISPDEGEFGDDELSQFGFTVIPYQGDITTRKDFPKGREEEVKPFLWKYIQ